MVISEPMFEQADVLKVVRPLTEKKLQAWIHRGHVKLQAQPKGPGHRKLWTALEVIRLGAIVEAVENGLPVGWATGLADRIVTRAEDIPKDHFLKPGNAEPFSKPVYFALHDSIVAYTDGVDWADVKEQLWGHPVITVIHADMLINEMVCRMAELLAQKAGKQGK